MEYSIGFEVECEDDRVINNSLVGEIKKVRCIEEESPKKKIGEGFIKFLTSLRSSYSKYQLAAAACLLLCKITSIFCITTIIGGIYVPLLRDKTYVLLGMSIFFLVCCFIMVGYSYKRDMPRLDNEENEANTN